MASSRTYRFIPATERAQRNWEIAGFERGAGMYALSLLLPCLACAFARTDPRSLRQAGTEMPLVVPDPMILRGLDWLWDQREPDAGFGDCTARAVLALQLANTSIWYPGNLLSLITVKQMDIEILVKLSRHGDGTTDPGDLSAYAIALTALCRDPRQFYGHDLVARIDRRETIFDLEFALSSLAVCTSGTHARKRRIRRLLDIAESSRDVGIETVSAAVLALRCIVRDHRNRNLRHYLLPPTRALGKLQRDDGSFGSLDETALAIQALLSTDPGGHHWNKTRAVDYIRRLQNGDGSFGEGDVLSTTISVLLALGPRGLADIKDLSCRPGEIDDGETARFPAGKSDRPFHLLSDGSGDSTTERPSLSDPTRSDNNSSDGGNDRPELASSLSSRGADAGESGKAPHGPSNSATITYTLWVGTDASEVHNVTIATESNNTFYNVMQLAAEKDEHFSFSSTEWPNGHYVHTLAGYKEEPMSYHYWLLYKLPSPPDASAPPPNRFVAPVGVDELLVRDGEHYLFWYKKL